jgi:hypothetical protein
MMYVSRREEVESLSSLRVNNYELFRSSEEDVNVLTAAPGLVPFY